MTRTHFRRVLTAGALVAVTWNAMPLAQAAESLLRSIPQVRSAYQDKLDTIGRRITPRVFLGTASVVPERSESYSASIGLRGVPQERGHFCGGAIVDPHWVLTAAHCVSAPVPGADKSVSAPVDPGKLQVLTGTNVLFRDAPAQPVARIVRHPEYRVRADGVPENDLALLQFAAPLKGTPAPLATAAQAEQALQPGNKLLIAGWGTASFEPAGAISNNLLFAYVDFVDRAKCNDPAVYAGAVTDKMFCAGLGNADSCQGDSGGLAAGLAGGRGFVVGIVSWGAGCTSKKYPGVYVDVAKYLGWINETIGKPRS